ncbi:MAG: vWA domain-containing protein [Candidatus Eisenbacteria bacterium]
MPHLDIGFLIDPGLFWWIAIACALLTGVWAYWRLPAPLGSLERMALPALRLGALIVILLLLLEPLLTLHLRDSGRPHVAVLVDRSSSMALPGRDGGTRGDEATAVLARLEEELEGKFALDVYGFADGVERRRAEESGYPWTALGATALGEALEEVLLRQGEGALGAMIVVSDGIHTAGKDPLRVARNLPVPAYALLLGDTTAAPDLQIREIRAQPVAQVGEPIAVRTWLRESGLQEWQATLTVREVSRGPASATAPAREVARREVSLDGAGAEIEVPLEIVPSRVGLALYEVEASITDSEAVAINNRRLFAVDVREKKTRVLYLEGEPDWDFSFLKRALDADTTLSYTYLVRRGKEGFFRYGGEQAQPLPQRREDLAAYAAVLIGRLSPAEVPAGFAEALKGYLLEGGGVLFLGAARHEGTERWADAGWQELLPLDIVPQRRWGYAASPCQPTSEAIMHEVTVLAENPAETERIWRAFPPVWIHEGDYRTSPAAAVLLSGRTAHPDREVPLLAVAQAGAGRIACLGCRGFWRWDFAMGSHEIGSAAARDFWKRLVRWLSEPGEQERFALRPARLVFQDSEPVAFTARLLDEGFRPVAAARVDVEVRSLGSGDGAGAEPFADPAADDGAEARPGRAGSRDEPLRVSLFPEGVSGRYAGTLAPLRPGAYRYEARARTDGEKVLHSEGLFWVDAMGPEFYALASSPRLLARMAESSGGAFRTSAQIGELLEMIPAGYRRTPVVKQAEMWNHWPMFAFLTAVLAAEWIWRRRRGLA